MKKKIHILKNIDKKNVLSHWHVYNKQTNYAHAVTNIPLSHLGANYFVFRLVEDKVVVMLLV